MQKSKFFQLIFLYLLIEIDSTIIIKKELFI
nr:MAG TPA: hypothetical protein [Bacteriophage sp.]